MSMGGNCSYYRILVRYPCLVILTTFAIVTGLSVVGLWRYGADYLTSCFEDPTLGYEARGTEISDSTISMYNLDESIPTKNNWTPNTTFSGAVPLLATGRDIEGVPPGDPECAANIHEDGVYVHDSRFVFESTTNQNLMSADHLRAICDLEDDAIRSYFRYECRSYSVPLFVAALAGKNCSDIEPEDVSATNDLLKQCYSYYEDGSLLDRCTNVTCPTVPPECYDYQAVYAILYYHADLDFGEQVKNQEPEPFLKYTMMITQEELPYQQRKDYYHDEVEDETLKNDLVIITGMELGYNWDLFTYYMITDMVYFALAMIIIVLILVLYLKSAVMALATFLNVIFSYFVAYFVYHIIFRFEFFPFINLIVILLLIAIGADDVFIFHDAWESAKLEIPEKREPDLQSDEMVEVEIGVDLPQKEGYAWMKTRLNGTLDGQAGISYKGDTNHAFEEDDISPEVSKDGGSIAADTKFTSENSAEMARSHSPQEDIDSPNHCQYSNQQDTETASHLSSTAPQVLADYMELWMGRTFRHAATSILVTSLTTASALFANYVSKVVVIRCFGIFAMTAVLMNFLLMITWVPSFLVLNEKVNRAVSRCCKKKCTCKRCQGDRPNYCQRVVATFVSAKDAFFGRCMPFLVSKAWFVWILLFSGVGIGGIVVVFITPGLQLPSTTHFPLYPSDHVFEAYNSELKWYFEFENPDADDGFPVDFVWGVRKVDNGNVLNPFDRGSLEMDAHVDLFAEASQTWMVNFCRNLKNETFVSDADKLLECSYQIYWDLLQGPCLPSVNGTLDRPCCETDVPANESQFEFCTPLMSASAAAAGRAPWLGLHLYEQTSNVINAFVIEIQTSEPWTAEYDDMDSLYKEIGRFLDGELASAPDGLEQGWFFGYFTFYDLQKELARGTYTALAIAIGLALFFLIVTTKNLLLSLYALINISFVIFTTMGTLVLMGWELNIVESSIFTMAVGMSIDFTIHYGVAYVHALPETRLGKVTETFERVGSAVSMAALTTFLAGACIMPSNIIAYKQLGSFLMLVMVYSWTFSSFLFQSLCVAAGPVGGFSQIKKSWLKCECCPKSKFTKCCGFRDEQDISTDAQTRDGQANSEIAQETEGTVQGKSFTMYPSKVSPSIDDGHISPR